MGVPTQQPGGQIASQVTTCFGLEDQVSTLIIYIPHFHVCQAEGVQLSSLAVVRVKVLMPTFQNTVYSNAPA
jgi:hypothetical protein